MVAGEVAGHMTEWRLLAAKNLARMTEWARIAVRQPWGRELIGSLVEDIALGNAISLPLWSDNGSEDLQRNQILPIRSL
ncbi:hypothetical protein [Mesorhizobium sp. M0276]|uniref:hypothetical protein n=1 Tax=Mesorhizobium sp. M0276 TaxID=2956928 RepID=UPI003335111E